VVRSLNHVQRWFCQVTRTTGLHTPKTLKNDHLSPPPRSKKSISESAEQVWFFRPMDGAHNPRFNVVWIAGYRYETNTAGLFAWALVDPEDFDRLNRQR